MAGENNFLRLGWELLWAVVVTALCSPSTGTPAKRSNRWLRRNAIAIVSVIIALCALGATFWQGSIARDAEQRQLRAYMAVDVLPMKGFEVNSTPTAGAIITVKGQTPAYDISLKTHIASLSYPLKADIRSVRVPEAAEVASTMRAPEQQAGNQVSLAYSLAPEQYSILQIGKACRLYVWGEVGYKDAFDERRQSRFCYSFDASKPAEPIFEACPIGNCADRQCQEIDARLRPPQVSDANDCKGSP